MTIHAQASKLDMGKVRQGPPADDRGGGSLARAIRDRIYPKWVARGAGRLSQMAHADPGAVTDGVREGACYHHSQNRPAHLYDSPCGKSADRPSSHAGRRLPCLREQSGVDGVDIMRLIALVLVVVTGPVFAQDDTNRRADLTREIRETQTRMAALVLASLGTHQATWQSCGGSKPSPILRWRDISYRIVELLKLMPKHEARAIFGDSLKWSARGKSKCASDTIASALRGARENVEDLYEATIKLETNQLK